MKIYRIASDQDFNTSKDIWKLIKKLQGSGGTIADESNLVEFLRERLQETKDEEIIKYMFKNISEFRGRGTLLHGLMRNSISWGLPEHIKKAFNVCYIAYPEYWVGLIGDLGARLKLMKDLGMIAKEDPSKHKIEEITEQKGKGSEELEKLLASSYNWYKMASDWKDKHTIYEDVTGYIKGYQADDGRWWIMEFAVKPEYRGKGKARELASHLPWQCRLYAHPTADSTMGLDDLIKFYERLGFELVDRNQHIMVRG